MRRALVLSAVLALSACSRANVAPLQSAGDAGTAPSVQRAAPAIVSVEAFRLEARDVTLDSAPALRVRRAMSGEGEGEERAEAAREATVAFQAALIRELRQRGLNAVQPGVEPTMFPRLTIRGTFTTLEQGNRARRAVVGFGLGASRVAGNAELAYSAAAGQPADLLTRFALDADSGAMPGAVIGGGAGAGAVVVGTAARGTAGQVRGPQEIGTLAAAAADSIATFAVAQGWRQRP